jgi:hypothetical protein
MISMEKDYSIVKYLANTSIDLAGLSSGIYFYSLQHRSSYNTGKLIKK